MQTPSKQPKASAKVKSTPSKVVYKEDSVAESEEAVEEDDGSAFAPSPVASEQEDLAHESESEFEGGSDVSEVSARRCTADSVALGNQEEEVNPFQAKG